MKGQNGVNRGHALHVIEKDVVWRVGRRKVYLESQRLWFDKDRLVREDGRELRGIWKEWYGG